MLYCNLERAGPSLRTSSDTSARHKPSTSLGCLSLLGLANMENTSSSHQNANQAAFNANNQGLSFSQPDLSPSTDTPTKHGSGSAYTPEQIKQVLSDALSSPFPTSSSAFQTPRKSFAERVAEAGSLIDEFADEDADTEGERSPSPLAQKPRPNASSFPEMDTMPETPRLVPVSSPIRPLASPAYRNPQQRTFAVEASFLQAMSGVLERQANIVPDHMLTESEVRAIVRSELKKRDQAQTKNVHDVKVDRLTTETLASRVTPPRMAMITAVFAGALVLRRAALKHPGEMYWCASGAVKGGILGLLGALGAKGAMWAAEKFWSKEGRSHGAADVNITQ